MLLFHVSFPSYLWAGTFQNVFLISTSTFGIPSATFLCVFNWDPPKKTVELVAIHYAILQAGSTSLLNKIYQSFVERPLATHRPDPPKNLPQLL